MSIATAPVDVTMVERTWKYTSWPVTGVCEAGGVTQASTGVCALAATSTVVIAAPVQVPPAATNLTVQPAGRLPGKLLVWLAARL
ncbi:hypothetical protein D3C86_514980 [compost metagenome]